MALDTRPLRAIAGRLGPSEPTGDLDPLIHTLRRRYGDTLRAIVYYGACFRAADAYAGLVDFYVIVDRYRHAHTSRLAAVANRVLPPNVYYLAQQTAGGTLRCKYAVLSMAHVQAGASRWFQSSIWGRFAQPLGLVYTRSTNDARLIQTVCGHAVLSLLRRSLPALPARLPAAQAYARSLALSYSGELRVESAGRSDELVAADTHEYQRRLAAAAPLLPFPVLIKDQGTTVATRIGRYRRARARIAWPLRRLQGRLLSVLRLVKACFTFTDAVDYGVDKLQRHTGVAIDVTPRLRRFPWLFGWGVLWRLYRQRRLR